VVLLAALVMADPSPPPVDPLPQPQPAAVVDRQLRDPVITESSGLALSPTHAGVIWTMNDSGNAPALYAVGRDGTTEATVRLDGVPNRDWEAIAAWRDGTGKPLLAVADIGDNGARRTEIEIDVVREPARLADARLPVLRRLRLRYPDGAADAETLLVDPRTQRMYLVTKGLLRARIFAVPARTFPGTATEVAELEPLGAVGLQLATDGTVLPSGRVLLRSYGALMLLAPLTGPGAAPASIRPLGTVNLPAQSQGEGLAATAASVYLSSEGAGSVILRVPMPASFPAGVTASVSPGAGASPGGSLTSDPASPGLGRSGADGLGGDGRPGGRRWSGALGALGLVGLVGLGGLVGLLGLVGAIALRRRGRRLG
jgi:hypothetical protein